ncbi:MAG: helix-turn-helix domain-containing protein, partial [Methylacidiphilales bacterium]|nr:helix-turn-helix domain-containing protein [Candidatus Methylacidiphilales bacterium]
MPLGRPIIGLNITQEQQQELQAMVRSRSLPTGLTLRAKIVLACAKGQGTPAVAADLGISAQTACKWRERFRVGGVAALRDEVRPGRPRTIREE